MSPCPHRKLLVAFEDGCLSDADVAPIERHLQHCAACQSSMSKIRDGDRPAQIIRQAFQVTCGDAIDATPGGAERVARAQSSHPIASSSDGQTPGDALARNVLGLTPVDWDIPDYEFVVLCGDGAYGSVWAVRDRVGVYRALKVIDLERMSRLGVACRERAALETYCRKVRHGPHLIKVYHVGEVGNLLYYTMDLADDARRGPVRDAFPVQYHPLTLDRVAREKWLRIDVVIEIIRRLLRGLTTLHEADLVHRDVKPSNIVFVDGSPKLADIGILAAESDSTQPVGTPTYMPPDKVMDKSADTFAAGKILFEMLAGAGRGVFPELPPDRRWYDSGWDYEGVSRLILRASSDRASGRYESASQMLEDLERCVELTYGSLFDELDEITDAPGSSTAREAIQLGYALLRMIPWLFGILALLVLMSLLANQV